VGDKFKSFLIKIKTIALPETLSAGLNVSDDFFDTAMSLAQPKYHYVQQRIMKNIVLTE